MALPRFAWGIDIGNRALKAVKLIPSAEGLKVDEFEVIEHETVLSESGDNREALIQSALANFVQHHPGVEKGQVGVGVSGQQSFARFIKLPPVEDKKIPEIVRFEAIQQIPFPLDDVEWSYQLFREENSPEVEVGIFAMRKELVNAHIANFTDIDLNVQVVQMNPLAVYNAMYYDGRIKGTTMIVDLGAENTDLIIADGETVWLRSISIGGNNFTEALTKAFKVNFTKAEDLKRNAGTSKYGRQIMQAMRPIFADLVSEIQRSIGFYASVHRDSRIGQVIALGSTFRLPGLQKYLQQNLQLEVEKIDSLTAGTPSDPKLAASFSENILSTIGAYGLALQVMGQGKITSSLLPEAIRREKMWREKTKWFAGAAALFVFGAAVPYGSYYFNNWQLNQQASLQSAIANVQQQATALDGQWAQIEQSGGPDRQRISNMQSLLQYRGMMSDFMQDVYGALPQNAADADKALTSGNLDEMKQIKRPERRQIFIEKIGSKYYGDLSTALTAPSLGIYADENSSPSFDSTGNGGDMPSAAPMPSPDASPPLDASGAPPGPPVPPAGGAATTGRGYLVTIKCTTPNAAGVRFIEQTLVQKLLNIKVGNIPADKPYYVAKGVIAKKYFLRDDQTRMQAMTASWQARQQAAQAAAAAAAAGVAGPGLGAGMQPPSSPNFGGAGMPMGMPPGGMGGSAPFMPPGGSAGQGFPDEAYQDPILKEDVRNDTGCTLVFAVLLDPPPPPAKTPKAGG